MNGLLELCLGCMLMTPSAAPSLKRGDLCYVQRDYDCANASFTLGWMAAQQATPEDPARYEVLKRLTRVHRAKGEFPLAEGFLARAIEWREHNAGARDVKLGEDLIEEFLLCRIIKDYAQATAVVKRLMELDTAAAGEEPSKAVADDYSRMALIDLDEKKYEDAVAPLNLAIGMRSRLAGSLDPSLVPDLDRLGETYIALRDYAGAEFIYRQALVIREGAYGKEHADLIATVDGLAYACFGQQKYDEAEELYQRLLHLWVTSVGKEHPMVAIALDKIAMFYATQKKFDQAREAADHANAIRAFSLATGLELEATQQYDAGHVDVTKALLNRALKALEPSDPVYDDLHTEIAKIIAPLNKK